MNERSAPRSTARPGGSRGRWFVSASCSIGAATWRRGPRRSLPEPSPSAWWTPPIDAGLLPGCERAALLDAGSIAERSIRIQDLEVAEGLAVVSSVRPWRDAALIDAALQR